MIDMNFSYLAPNNFIGTLNSSEYYQRIAPNIIGDVIPIGGNIKKLASENVAVIALCSDIDSAMMQNNSNVVEERQAVKFYYRVEEKFNTYYLEFPTTLITFYHRRLQEINTKVFESGVKQYFTAHKRDYRKEIDEKYNENEKHLLKLIDVAPGFYLLSIGLIVSGIVLAFEIFCHDCLRQLNFRNIFRKRKREFKQRIRPRFIHVCSVRQDLV